MPYQIRRWQIFGLSMKTYGRANDEKILRRPLHLRERELRRINPRNVARSGLGDQPCGQEFCGIGVYRYLALAGITWNCGAQGEVDWVRSHIDCSIQRV